MRIKTYILITLVLALFEVLIDVQGKEESALSREYQIKAAFLYNFIKFVDWPKEKLADSNDTITIGVICKDSCKDAFELVENKTVKTRKIKVRMFRTFEELEKDGQKNKSEFHKEIEALKKCDVLFVCFAEENPIQIIEALKEAPVLTVGETSGFLEAGGVIRFFMEEKKVRFEINLDAADKVGLKIRSKLVRLAKRVISEKDTDEKKDE